MVRDSLLLAGGFALGFVLAYVILDQHFATQVELVRAQGEMEILNQTKLMTCRQVLDQRTQAVVVQCESVLYPLGGS